VSTVRQGILANAVADGMPIDQAGKLAGYRSLQNTYDAYRTMRDRIVGVMDGAGVTERMIAERLRDQLFATKTITASHFGEITDSIEVADNQAIGKAIETAARIRGMLDSDGNSTSIGTINILCHSQTIPDWSSANVDNNTLPIDNTSNRVGISTVEGTGPDPAPSTPTHSATPTLLARVETAKSVPAKVTKKRGPRLPVLGARNKR
jgi:hypothetical protein